MMKSAPLFLIVAGILVGSPVMASQQQAGLTEEEQEQADRMLSVQELTTQFLPDGQKEIGGLVFTPRWSEVVFVEPSSLSLIFADCLPGEFAVSGQQILSGSDLHVLESYALSLPDDFMVWVMVVENLNSNERLPASAGVICVSDGDDRDGAASVILQPRVKQEINNILKQFITIENNQIINLQQIINIRQQIIQNAVQIAIGGGNVTQIINQSASQIVAANATNIDQILNQTAIQVVEEVADEEEAIEEEVLEEEVLEEEEAPVTNQTDTEVLEEEAIEEEAPVTNQTQT